VYGNTAVVVRTGTLPLPAEHGVHPFAEVQSAHAMEHILLTVCTAQESGKPHGTLRVQQSASGFEIAGQHNARSLRMRISTEHDIPGILL